MPARLAKTPDLKITVNGNLNDRVLRFVRVASELKPPQSVGHPLNEFLSTFFAGDKDLLALFHASTPSMKT